MFMARGASGQPRHATRIDWSSPATRDLRCLLVPGVAVDLVHHENRLRGNTLGTRRALKAGPGGLCTDPASSGALCLPGPVDSSSIYAQQYDIAGPITVLGMFRQTSETNTGRVFVRGAGSGTPAWGVGLHGGSNDGASAVLGSYIYNPSAGDATMVGRLHVVAITGDGSTARVYYDGREIASGAYTPPTYAYDEPNDRCVIIGSSGSYQGLGTECYMGTLWARQVPGDEIKRLSLELLSGRWDALVEARRVWVPVSASSGQILAASSGSYILTGQELGLGVVRRLAAEQGAYGHNGQSVALGTARRLIAGQGSYSLTGQAVSVGLARRLVAEHGTYALTGQAVTLTHSQAGGYTLSTASGTYTVSGQANDLRAARRLVAAQGAYAVGGQAVQLVRSLRIAANAGTYALAGQPAAFARTWRLAADLGAYVLTGRPVTLSWTGSTAPPVLASIPAARRLRTGPAPRRPAELSVGRRRA